MIQTNEYVYERRVKLPFYLPRRGMLHPGWLWRFSQEELEQFSKFLEIDKPTDKVLKAENKVVKRYYENKDGRVSAIISKIAADFGVTRQCVHKWVKEGRAEAVPYTDPMEVYLDSIPRGRRRRRRGKK